ncbi:MAG: group III truncated hemoglobin [Chitinophagaceae bacterium]|nr:MAG: group III truncated hemoglobin [Chitinophagaceae bacterium]
MKDIETREDVVLLVDTFYQSVKENKKLGYIFKDVAKIDWEEHLPKMYSFWASILLGEQSFTGNPMIKHIALSKLTPMTEVEFEEWLLLFNTTIDQLFEGKVANEAKLRAGNIARLMMHKIESLKES